MVAGRGQASDWTLWSVLGLQRSKGTSFPGTEAAEVGSKLTGLQPGAASVPHSSGGPGSGLSIHMCQMG